MNPYFKALLLSAATLAVFNASAQEYHWEASPKMHAIPDKYSKESAVFILEKRNVQMVFDKKTQDPIVYRTVHRIIRLMDDKGVEYFNKMTLGSPRGAEIQNLEARTIKPGGKVITLTKNQIKTMNDEHGQLQYHLAFEGVEKGDEVEMYYTELRPFQEFGYEIMQIGLPIMKASFNMESPEYLRFESKGYNSFPTTKDTVIDDTRFYSAEQTDVDALEEETYSDVTPNQQRIEYRLSYTTNSDVKRNTWNSLAKILFERYYVFTDKELKAANKYLAPLKLDALKSDEEKIKAVEQAIKTDIVFDEGLRGEEQNRLQVIAEKKTAGETGLVRFFTACLQTAGIKYELGLTSNRFEFPLDEKFENWSRPDIYVLYFPKSQQYLSPTVTTLRYPVIPNAMRENKAIFCKTVSAGGLTSALASVRSIPAATMEESDNTLRAEVSFDPSGMSPTVRMKHSFRGYSAQGLREAVLLIPKEKEKELVKDMALGLADQPEDITSYSLANTGLQHYSDNLPLEINCEIKAEQLMETAGGKWLFKVGDVIGPQQEMYKSKERKLPISMAYPHSLIRDIVITIPEGYKITNPGSVVITEKMPDDNIGFASTYTLAGKTMSIHINEYYGTDYLPASAIDPFRKVINAAADFNKVVLVMEKE